MGDPSSSIPSHQRPEPGSINVPIAPFPLTTVPEATDAGNVAGQWLKQLNGVLTNQGTSGLSSLFDADSFWRDHLAVSWDFRTAKGTDQITSLLSASVDKQGGYRLKSISLDTSSQLRSPCVTSFDAPGRAQGVQACLTVTTDAGTGRGLLRLVHKDGAWKAFTISTFLEEIQGHEEAILHRRPQGVEHGGIPDRRNWLDRRVAQSNFEKEDPTVLILGAGQAGLSVAARLKMMGIEALIVDREQKIGDNWRTRYHQLVLHDPVWFDHMPYINFPPSWPVFTPKDKLADFFESYAKLLELNVWVETTVTKSSWDDKERRWTISLKRQQGEVTKEYTIKPNHVIQATGHSGKKKFPSQINGISEFAGDVLCHSSEFPGANPKGAGKNAVVVGSCNSGHDIAQDYFEKGYNVTMVQRSTTCVISSHAITKIGLAGLYEEGGPPVEDADLIIHGYPTAVLKGHQVGITALENKYDQKLLDGLEKAGFKCDRGPDDAGLLIKYFQRGGGYYIDVGASQLIIDGKIKIKQGQEITEILPHGIRFQDGSELPADEIVFATGYENMRSHTRMIFGDEVADRVNDVWGYDEEGEFRTIWRKSGHPGFWFMGGNLALCRYYSRLLALQIKAVELGLSGNEAN